MRKQAWRSYIASLHPRYIRKAYDNGSLFWVFYWLVIYPVIMGLANDNMSEFYDLMARMFIRLIPFMIMGWSNLNSKFLMTKMMYLSPMKEQEREEYINQVLLIKIGMSVFLGVCIEAIFAIFAGFHIGKIAAMMVANLSIGIASYISLETLGKMDRKIHTIVKDKTDNTKTSWANNLVIGAAILIIGAIAILEAGAEDSLTVFCNWYVVIAMIGLLVLDILIICKEYKATIALTGDYELAFKILGKVEPKNVKFDMFEKGSKKC